MRTLAFLSILASMLAAFGCSSAPVNERECSKSQAADGRVPEDCSAASRTPAGSTEDTTLPIRHGTTFERL